jgi:predicted RNA binding protein YcfA (HicA-like mRNA interferase family)
MAKLPALKAVDVLRALTRAGFITVRVTGSHHRLVHKEMPSRATTVPLHGGRDLAKPVLHAIIKQAGLTTDEFIDLL